MRIDVYFHNGDVGLEGKLDQVLAIVHALQLQGTKIMADLTVLTQKITDLEAQAAVNKQLLTDLLAALQSRGTTSQADINALADRVAAVTSGEASDDTAAQNTLTPPATPT